MAYNKEAQKKIDNQKDDIRKLKGKKVEIIEGLQQEIGIEERELLELELNKVEIQIEWAEDELKKLTQTDKNLHRAKRKLSIEEEVKMIDKIVNDFDVNFNPLLGKFIYCKDFANQESTTHCNPQFQMFEYTKIANMLRQWTKHTFQMTNEEIIQYFQENGNSHEMNVFTFHASNWNTDYVYNRAKILKNKYWVKPDYDLEGFAKDAFDDLFYCVAGGKQENIDHLKIWSAYKYLFPERNSSIPNIDLGGHPGGNGKNTFIIMLKTLFLRSTVKSTTKDELLKFNGPWEDAVILNYDEPEENELPASKMKNATGSDEQRIEKKGFDAYQADRNYNFIFTSNNPKGCIKLEGGGKGASDRRYSVITTDIVLRAYVKEKYGFQDEQAGEYINYILDIVKDRKQVSKWLGSVITEYKVHEMLELDALHGQDYHKRFEDQKTNLDIIFDEIIRVIEVTKVIPVEFVSQIIHAMSPEGSKKMDNRRLKTKLQTYINSNGLKDRVTFKERHHLRILWEGSVLDSTTDNIQTTCMLLDEGSSNFEFSEISKTRYRKKLPITKDDVKVAIV
jgi:hypothetical protein